MHTPTMPPATITDPSCGMLPATTIVDTETDLEVLKSVPKQFCVENEGSANWLVRRVLAAREYGRKVKAFAEQEQRRAEREEQTLLFLYGRQLETWTKSVLEKSAGRRKSLCLPAGTLGFRREPSKLIITDDEAVMGWAKVHCPQAVQTVERLLKTPINEHLETTGEMPTSGAILQLECEKFFIRS